MTHLLKTDTILDISNQLRKQGKKVVFTHGTFDLLHTGHTYVLENSKKKGDVLIVGVEPDANVEKYKGQGRPVIPEQYRAEQLAYHTSTDFIFYIDKIDYKKGFNSEYYLDLYKRLKPSVVTVGKNFYNKERKNAKVRGVKITQLRKLVPDPKTHAAVSTTGIIDKIKRL